MDDITLYITDIETSPDFEEVLNYVSYNPSTHLLYVETALATPNGISNLKGESESFEDFSISELYFKLFNYTSDISFDDLLANENLMDYFVQENNEEHLLEIKELYHTMIRDENLNVQDDDDLITLAIDYQDYGRFLKNIGHPDDAEVAYREEEKILHQFYLDNPDEENRHNELVALEDLADLLQKLEKFENALTLYKEMLEIKVEENDYEYGHILEKIGIVYNELDDYKTSLDYHLQEMNIYRNLYEQDPNNETAYNLSIALRQCGKRAMLLIDNHDSLDCFLESYELLKRIDEASVHDDLVIATELLGDIYLVQEDYNEAHNYYKEVEDMIKKEDEDDHLFSLSVIHKKRGRVNHRQKNYEEALKYYHLSLDEITAVSKKTNLYTHLAERGIGLMNIGWVYYDMKDYEHAHDYFYEDLKLRIVLNNEYHSIASSYSLSLAYRHMGYIEEELGQLQSARDHLKYCLDISYKHHLEEENEGRAHYYYVSLKDYAHILYVLGYLEEAYVDFKEVEDYLKQDNELYVHEYKLEYIDLKEMQLCKEKLNGIN